MPNYLDLLPRGYAWWLKRREEIRDFTRKAMEENTPRPVSTGRGMGEGKQG